MGKFAKSIRKGDKTVVRRSIPGPNLIPLEKLDKMWDVVLANKQTPDETVMLYYQAAIHSFVVDKLCSELLASGRDEQRIMSMLQEFYNEACHSLSQNIERLGGEKARFN